MLKISRYYEKIHYQYYFTIIDSDTGKEVLELVYPSDHKMDDKEILERESVLLSEAQEKVDSRDARPVTKQFPTQEF